MIFSYIPDFLSAEYKHNPCRSNKKDMKHSVNIIL